MNMLGLISGIVFSALGGYGCAVGILDVVRGYVDIDTIGLSGAGLACLLGGVTLILLSIWG